MDSTCQVTWKPHTRYFRACRTRSKLGLTNLGHSQPYAHWASAVWWLFRLLSFKSTSSLRPNGQVERQSVDFIVFRGVSKHLHICRLFNSDWRMLVTGFCRFVDTCVWLVLPPCTLSLELESIPVMRSFKLSERIFHTRLDDILSSDYSLLLHSSKYIPVS